jgi:hypothetical protein
MTPPAPVTVVQRGADDLVLSALVPSAAPKVRFFHEGPSSGPRIHRSADVYHPPRSSSI